MATLNIRIKDEDKKMFDEYAKFHGMTLSNFIKTTILEKIEEDIDIQECKKILRTSKKEDFISLDEAIKEWNKWDSEK